ncbi:DUF6988 family protein [Stenotrophomonas maltophilia]|uniref:DUF6988 family protein n=1 Tax=Stenotrophomonas maltophilia TaxID=40324 RepID=UPI0013DBC0A2|nr:hypothetical protein [Stenotrophomonas maltophilia]MBN4977728.1 hypothetical protein [Stenotrophomonas maltophilia]
MTQESLKDANRDAREPQTAKRLPTALDIAQEAREAKASLESNMSCMARITVPAGSERHRVTFQLLRASMDYARALLFLLETHPIDLPAVALAMHRSQIEQFLRAVFVQFLADDEQLADFLQEDRGPRKKNEKGKWVAIALKDLAADVEQAIARIGQDDEPQKLARTVTNSWDPLCGLVHGGKAIRVMYQDPNGQIGAHVPAAILFPTTVNAVATTNLCVIAALTAVGVGAFEESPVVEQCASGMLHYMQRRKARMEELAWPP